MERRKRGKMNPEFCYQGFKEIFQCTVMGANITEARFNAMSALEAACGEIISVHSWKMIAFEHTFTIVEDDEGNKSPAVQLNAAWIFDQENADGEGGTHADLLPPDGNGNPGDAVVPENEVEEIRA